MEAFNLCSYRQMLRSFKEAGYDFRKFQDINASTIQGSSPFVLMRHDVDFSLWNAVDIANLEGQEKIQSTFFFKLCSPLYNLLSEYAIQIVREIYELGHDVGLHFDLGSHGDNWLNQLIQEIQFFSKYFPFANTQIVSFHRPGRNIEALQELNLPCQMRHTYEKIYFSDIAYFSDSRCEWQSCNPTKSEAFRQRAPLQLLTHPLWWGEEGEDRIKKIHNYLETDRKKRIDHIEKTVVSFSLQFLRHD